MINGQDGFSVQKKLIIVTKMLTGKDLLSVKSYPLQTVK